MSDGDAIRFASGAVCAHGALRYDLVPRVLLDEVAARFTAGATKYGDDNWQKGVADPAFLRERANHALEHLLNYIHGTDNGEDSPSDNLAAVGWAVAVLLEAERRREEKREVVSRSNGLLSNR